VITETRCYVASCDSCGAEPESADGYIPHFASPEEFEANEYEWTIWQDKTWCEDCGASVCMCGHLFGEHDYGEAPCENESAEGCPCQAYAPDEARSEREMRLELK